AFDPDLPAIDLALLGADLGDQVGAGLEERLDGRPQGLLDVVGQAENLTPEPLLLATDVTAPQPRLPRVGARHGLVGFSFPDASGLVHGVAPPRRCATLARDRAVGITAAHPLYAAALPVPYPIITNRWSTRACQSPRARSGVRGRSWRW